MVSTESRTWRVERVPSILDLLSPSQLPFVCVCVIAVSKSWVWIDWEWQSKQCIWHYSLTTHTHTPVTPDTSPSPCQISPLDIHIAKSNPLHEHTSVSSSLNSIQGSDFPSLILLGGGREVDLCFALTRLAGYDLHEAPSFPSSSRKTLPKLLMRLLDCSEGWDWEMPRPL